MPKKAILFLGVYGVLAAATLIYPHVGLWGYLFEWYNHPPYHWWGKPLNALGDRWSFYIAFIMLGSFVIHYNKYQTVEFFSHTQTKFIFLFSFNAFLVSLWAYNPEKSYQVAIEHAKMFLIYWCIVKTHSDKKYYFIPILISLLGCINWGIDVTFNPQGGRSVNAGGPTAVGENFVSPHVVAFLPLAALMVLTETKWIRWACLLGIPFMVNIVAHASSRGAFLAMIVAALSVLFFSKRKIRKWSVVGIILGLLLCLNLFHEQFWNRQETLVNYEEDASAMGRIYAWKAAIQLADDNWFGYGGEGFDSGLGAPLMPLGFHTTHNMFFEILVAWGAQGIFFFYGFILISCRDCWVIFKSQWDGFLWPPPREAVCALGILCGFCSMLTASMFLNRYRWELWWFFGGLTVCLKNIIANGFITEQIDKQPNKL